MGASITVPSSDQVRPRAKRDVRLVAVALLLASILGVYVVLGVFTADTQNERRSAANNPPAQGPEPARPGFEGLVPGRAAPPQRELPETSIPDNKSTRTSTGQAVRSLLEQATRETASGKHDSALRTLNKIRPLDPENPLAYLKIGEALLGKKDYATARDFFAAAIDRNPVLPGAYFGFAVASEGLGDLESALGGMRSYLHVETDKTPGRLPVAQARSAIWEWESQLGRGPWGPTRGIPPGFTADEIKRDGRGTAVRMQKPETLRPDGTMDWEIKSAERFPELWKP